MSKFVLDFATKKLTTSLTPFLETLVLKASNSQLLQKISTGNRVDMTKLRTVYFKSNETMLKAAKKHAIDLEKPMSKLSKQETEIILDQTINREVIKEEVQTLTKSVSSKSMSSISKRQGKLYKKKPHYTDPTFRDYMQPQLLKNPNESVGEVLKKIYRPGGQDIVPEEINIIAEKTTSLTKKQSTSMSMKDFQDIIESYAESEPSKLLKYNPVLKQKIDSLAKTVDTRAKGELIVRPKNELVTIAQDIGDKLKKKNVVSKEKASIVTPKTKKQEPSLSRI